MDPDPAPFSSDFKDAKKKFSNIPPGTLPAVLKILFFAKILFYLFCKHYFSPLNDPDPEPDPYI
jgi:hypothetical protein